MFSCYLLNYRQRIIRGERTTNFKGRIEIYVVSLNYGVFNDFNDIEDYKIPMIKLELIGDYFNTVKILNVFDSYFKLKEEQFWGILPLKPFKIMGYLDMYCDELFREFFLSINRRNRIVNEESNNEESDNEEPNNEESDNEGTKIQTEPSFKNVKCVICLTNISNVLFCNCGHICTCSECVILKCLDICPMCRVKTTIKRKIE